MTRMYGRAAPGERVVETVPQNYGENVSMLAAISLGGIEAPMTISGAVDGLIFLEYVKQVLCPTLPVENNTVFNSGNPITAHRAPTQNFIFRNNIFSYGTYGFVGDDITGQAVFAKYFADGTIVNNLVVNANKAEKQ